MGITISAAAILQSISSCQSSLPLAAIPDSLAGYGLRTSEDRGALTYAYDAGAAEGRVAALLADLQRTGIQVRDIHTRQSSLEDIFIDLVRE